jgi:hypothetical protein
VLAAEKELALRSSTPRRRARRPPSAPPSRSGPTAQLAGLLAYGRGVQRQLDGDFRGALDEFSRAAASIPNFRQARDRAGQARALSESGVAAARVSVPGVRAVDAAVAGTLDRINRPLDFITSTVRSTGSPADPAFPSTVATVVIRVTRP